MTILISMQCPFCEYQDSRGAVHQHLLAAHGDQVKLRVDEERGKRFYSITCPICAAPYEHQVKPRNLDQNFLQAFDREIRLVAFDMLLYHLQGEHPETSDHTIQTTKT
jgi:hypothetical protein